MVDHFFDFQDFCFGLDKVLLEEIINDSNGKTDHSVIFGIDVINEFFKKIGK
jgi:hypothetical protein